MSLINWKNYNKNLPALHVPSWMDNFFRDDDFFENRWLGKEMTVPAINVSETPEGYQLEVAAPGMKKSDFKIEVKEGTMVISAHTQSEKEEEKDSYTRKEFNYTSFSRSFWLPENVKSDNIEASYTDGLLKIHVPKTEAGKEVQTRQVAIS